MKLVIDTNYLFSFFWRSAFASKLLLADHDLYSHEFALRELEKHKEEIMTKTKLTSEDFREFKLLLQKVIEFVQFSEYSNYIPEAFQLLPEHQKDIDFLALAISLNAAILSKDKKLKEQSKIKVFNEKEFYQLLE